jgi:2,3-dihydroxy-p-cumate/2,3-dihydroxybenzoate 3,4-dioxygenase
VSDWAGDALIWFDSAHHRIMLVPAVRPGILCVEYAVENVDLLMRNSYVLRDLQVAVLQPRTASASAAILGCRPLTLFGFVAESAAVAADGHRPRQFPPALRDVQLGQQCKIAG